MNLTKYFYVSRCLPYLLALCVIYSCNPTRSELAPVSYEQFEQFVNTTHYVTDAEKYGWSIVQQNVFDFLKVDSADWRRPDGIHPPESRDLPVTQVSYNDAMAYCKWSGTRLPTYDEYWKLTKSDTRSIVSENILPISPVDEVNVIGNVWDITSTSSQQNIRIAGGSLFCSSNTCNGTIKDRELYVDKETGNIHIGFSVIK